VNEKQITDLTYIRDFSENDKVFILDMIRLFTEDTPQDLKEMEMAFRNQDYDSLAEVAHRLKPSITFFGIDEIKEDMIELEELCKKRSEPSEIEKLLKKIQITCLKAISELETKKEDI
jgi:HPt (histidine-containing phosphotransfer) domain-containing protein